MSPQPRLNNSNVGILIVEDSPTQAEHLRYLLDENGYRVTVAGNGKEALAAARQQTPSLIISDIVMPEMDGYALCKEIKSQPALKNVPVILLTSLASSVDIIRGLECGADKFIPKPYEEDYLLSHIQNTLINLDLRTKSKTQMGVEIVFANQKYFITSERQQILDLLLSTYETAVQKNLQLAESQKELKKLNEQLDQKVVELEAQNRLVQQANRLKSEFLANMSHELRTPLNAIIGFSQLMHDGKVGPIATDHKEYLGDILTSARHLLQLINDVLDLAKVESGKMEFSPESVNLKTIIGEVRQILQTLSASKRLLVEVEVSTDVEQVIIDPAKLKQVLYNYLSNAIKFTPDARRITIRALADGSDFFRLEVEDTGIGIAPDEIGKLFTEFQQLDASTAKKHQGTGLGLALTKRIVEAQGGRVGVQSMVGQGSVFYAVLPKITARKTETSAERYTIAAPATDSPNVLVVEDNENDLQWIAKILSEQGHSLDSARTGAEALAKTKATVYSVILLDLILPDMIGWDVLHSMRMEGANQHTPVIVVTLVAEKEMARGFPVQDYLTKPLSPQSLIDSLKSAGVQSNGARKKVLVIDDDPHALKIARVALQSSRYEAVCHISSKSGLAAAAESSFDAVVIDLLMPEIDGFEFLDRFREIAGCRDTPVIVWTNKDITAKERERLDQSAQSIALKDGDGIDAVLRELQRYVASTAEQSPPTERAL